MSTPGIAMTARVDPPADVQQKVGAAIEACHAWRPVVVQAPVHDTIESGVCGLIDDWPIHANAAGQQLLWFGVLFGIVGFLFFRMAWRITCSLYQVVRARVAQNMRSA